MVCAEDISLILPQQHARRITRAEDFMEPAVPKNTHDAPRTVRPGPVLFRKPAHRCSRLCETVFDTEQGAGLGLGIGLLAAMCIPGLDLIAGAAITVVYLMAGGAVIGGIAGGIYGYLVDLGVAHGIAQVLSNHIEGGGAAVSVKMSGTPTGTEIGRILKAFGGHLIQSS